MPEFKVGDEVSVDSPKYPGVWKVVKVNPTTYRLMQNGHALKAHHSLTLPPLPANVQNKVDAAIRAAVPDPFETLPAQYAGGFVRTTAPMSKMPKGSVFIVLVDKVERVNCVVPGGDNGRYWRIPRRMLEPVAKEDVWAL